MAIQNRPIDNEPVQDIEVWRYFVTQSSGELKDATLDLNGLKNFPESTLTEAMSILTSGEVKNNTVLSLQNYDQKLPANRFQKSHMKIITDALESGECPSDFTLDLTFSWLGSEREKIQLLANAIKSKRCPPSFTLNLSQNYLHNCLTYFSGALINCPPNFKLFLRRCSLQEIDLAVIAKEFENPQCQMTLLSLVDNPITNEGALILLAAIKKRARQFEASLKEKKISVDKVKSSPLELWLQDTFITQPLFDEINKALKKISAKDSKEMDKKEIRPYQYEAPLTDMSAWSYVMESGSQLLKNPHLNLSQLYSLPLEEFKKVISALSSGFVPSKMCLDLSKPHILTFPHFEILSNGLKSGKFPSQFSLNLTSACDESKSLDLIAEALENKSCPEGMTLNLSKNKMSFERVLKTLKHCPSDFRLILDDCELKNSDMAHIASQIGNIECQIKYLSLKNNGITNDGAIALLSAVRKRAPGLEISLEGNKISEKYLIAIKNQLNNSFYQCAVMLQGASILNLSDNTLGIIYKFLIPKLNRTEVPDENKVPGESKIPEFLIDLKLKMHKESKHGPKNKSVIVHLGSSLRLNSVFKRKQKQPEEKPKPKKTRKFGCSVM